MRLQRIPFHWVAAVLVVAAAGCQQSSEPPSKLAVAPTPLAPDTVLRTHWTGKHSLGVAASAYSLMRLWELPESKQFQAYVLSRLSVATFGASGPDAAPNPAVALLTDDLVDREWFLELRQRTNQPPQFVFAIRLDETQARAWRVNLAGAFSSATGVHPTMQAASWTLKHPRTQQLIELHQVSGWTLAGVSMGQNELLAEASDRIRRDGAPAGWQQAGSWLELDADLNRLVGLLQPGTLSNASLPRLVLTVGGDGAHAVTRATLDFKRPLDLDLPPWRFPVDQISQPLVGFTAVRGFAGGLGSSAAWRNLGLGAAPDQCFVWAEATAPLRMHFAAPVPATLDLRRTSADWIARGNAWLKQNGIGQLVAQPEGAGVSWQGLPVISPFVTSGGSGSNSWLVGGAVAGNPAAASAPPPVYPQPSLTALQAEIQGRSNLVAYAWETTGSRAESFYLISQVLRVARLHPQMPAEAPSSQWIQSVRARLGNATTTVTLTSPQQLTLERRSTAGFTAAELHLLSDWLESPDFPRGLYSTRTRRAASAAEFQAQP